MTSPTTLRDRLETDAALARALRGTAHTLPGVSSLADIRDDIDADDLVAPGPGIAGVDVLALASILAELDR